MLTLTDNATTIVKDITSQQADADALRITADDAREASFSVAAGQQQPGDQIVEQQGATLYLDETAAQVLDDKVLDAAVDEGGRVEFVLGFQG
ncbi:MAG: Fe-S cluster assembly protein HesB [Nocardioides sp.]|nr:Fe-S cluster assembly protein HesB [Nocardioides sp.]